MGKLDVTVDHELEGDQITYIVMLTSSLTEYPSKNWSVRRRYNQFRALYERLEKITDFPLWFKFPERTYIISKNDPDIVADRKVAFRKLCQTIATDPNLRVHSTVKQFLDPKDKFDLPIWS